MRSVIFSIFILVCIGRSLNGLINPDEYIRTFSLYSCSTLQEFYFCFYDFDLLSLTVLVRSVYHPKTLWRIYVYKVQRHAIS